MKDYIVFCCYQTLQPPSQHVESFMNTAIDYGYRRALKAPINRSIKLEFGLSALDIAAKANAEGYTCLAGLRPLFSVAVEGGVSESIKESLNNFRQCSDYADIRGDLLREMTVQGGLSLLPEIINNEDGSTYMCRAHHFATASGFYL